MNYESYGDIRIAYDLQAFLFVSVGVYGNIKGMVFTPTESPLVSNNFEELSEKFEIKVRRSESSKFIPFQKNIEVSEFLIKRKFF